MSILTTIAAALALFNSVSNINLSASDVQIKKNNLLRDYVIASNDQNGYCLEFLNNLEKTNQIQDFTNVTVLTHGLGSSYKDWLPIYRNENGDASDSKCLETDYSIPFVINNYANNLNDIDLPIYVFKPVDPVDADTYNDDFKKISIRQFTMDSNNVCGLKAVNKIEIDDIISKRIVLIYNDPNSQWCDLDISAKRFELALSNILCQIYNAQLGNLGKINLIGHSRGGLINLLFATKHAKLVNNMISLGTPFEGSSWARIFYDVKYMSALAYDYNHIPQDVLVLQDLLNPDHITKHSSLFNSKCTNINSYALGFNMTGAALLCFFISYFKGNNFAINCLENIDSFLSNPEQMLSSINETISNAPLLEIIIQVIEELTGQEINFEGLTTELMINKFVAAIMRIIKKVCEASFTIACGAKAISDLSVLVCNFFGGNQEANKTNTILGAVVDFISNIIFAVNDCPSAWLSLGVPSENINSDVCVNTNSQIGANYFNFDKTDIITISPLSNPSIYDYEHCARPDDALAPHNFETKNPEAINNIMDFLSLHNGLDTFDILSIDITKPISFAVFVDDKEAIESLFSTRTITPSMYGFEDYYVYEKDLKNNPVRGTKSFIVDDSTVSTKILRTGYIQNEKIVLSPNRKDAGAAYIEYTFDKPIYKVDLNLSMWSENEDSLNSGQFLFLVHEQYKMNAIKNSFLYPRGSNISDYSTTGYTTSEIITNNLFNAHLLDLKMISAVPHKELFDTEIVHGSILGYEININNLSKNRNNQDKIEIYFDKPVTSFGLYTGVLQITSQTRNKGRVCIGDIVVYE